MENDSGLPPLILIAVVIFFGIRWIWKASWDNKVEAHKNELLKGGLVKRVTQDVHKEAMSQLGREYPNKHLPKRQYYD